jgi:hypothetical protein
VLGTGERADMVSSKIVGTLGCLLGAALSQLDAIPEGFDADKWAWYSNKDPLLAVVPGQFNRTVFQAPSAGNVSDPRSVAM